MGHRCRWTRPLSISLRETVRRQIAPGRGLRDLVPGEAVWQHLRVLTAQPRQLPVVRLSVCLVLVVLHGGVVGVELDLEAGHGNNTVHNGPLATQPSAFGQKVMTVLAIMVDDDPHLPVVAKI